MDETMNTTTEVTTEVSELGGLSQEIEETSGPSKGFVALVVGGIAAAAVGVAVAVKRHKKKKADESEIKDEDLDDYEDDFDEEQAAVVDGEVVEEVQDENSEKK